MPGILPMKMIRVGTNTQSRIAQACDRCRSKKIRCDGIRPCCTQCANVGFECKTSDKLSRRAFPRGYTESLEDRVRVLEAEVRDLKVLLDEKDEKIDMLSRIHNFSQQSRKSAVTPKSSAPVKTEEASPVQPEEVILVEVPVAVHPTNSSTGTSTTAALIEAFEERVQESNRSCPTISPLDLLKPQQPACKANAANAANTFTVAPPRLLSDQYINIFFQEWQPLLPILHRPTFLRSYEQYLLDPDTISLPNNKHGIAQLFLIFEIAAHSSSSRAKPATTAYEVQWRKALSSVTASPSIAAVQSHLLAQLSYLLKADYPHLLRYRAYGVSMVHQLCLHQGHKCHSLPPFEAETRKKVFWCQYVLDKFTSAVTGTPQILHDSDITAEHPADVDDENISPQGISPALPGELTKISSALALFRVSRILAKALGNLYPPKSSYQLSLTKLHSLSDELDQWQEELPDHLRLRFCNDKPATNLISCRSPLLSLAYFYIRGLVHRPLLCHGSGNAISAATIVLAAAAKHKIQILDLLDERSMNYTFPVAKQDLLLNAGFAILWQSIGLGTDSKLIKDNQRSLSMLNTKLNRENQRASSEFQKIASNFISTAKPRFSPTIFESKNQVSSIASSMPAPSNARQKSSKKQLQAVASRLSSFNGKSKNEDGMRRASMSQPGLYNAATSTSPSARPASTVSLSSTRSAPPLQTSTVDMSEMTDLLQNAAAINLDYFPINDDKIDYTSNNSSSTMLPPQKSHPPNNMQNDWDPSNSGSNMDSYHSDILNTVSSTVFDDPATLPESGTDWSGDLWQIMPYDIQPRANITQSLLSFSEESLASGDDVVFSATGSHNGSISTNEAIDATKMTCKTDAIRGIVMPTTEEL